MWGIPGAILSVPMLAITMIIYDRVRPLAEFGHFLEEESQLLSEARLIDAHIAEIYSVLTVSSPILISGFSCKTMFNKDYGLRVFVQTFLKKYWVPEEAKLPLDAWDKPSCASHFPDGS